MSTNRPMSPGQPAGASNRRESGKSMALDLDRTQDTPAGDLQPDDAGTPASGERPRDATVRSAMKQTSKTPDEGGSGQR
jgi:hypothetical protein